MATMAAVSRMLMGRNVGAENSNASISQFIVVNNNIQQAPTDNNKNNNNNNANNFSAVSAVQE